MSWSINTTGTKDEVKHSVAQNAFAYGHMPFSQLKAVYDAVDMAKGERISLNAYGSIYKDSGTGSMNIQVSLA